MPNQFDHTTEILHKETYAVHGNNGYIDGVVGTTTHWHSSTPYCEIYVHEKMRSVYMKDEYEFSDNFVNKHGIDLHYFSEVYTSRFHSSIENLVINTGLFIKLCNRVPELTCIVIPNTELIDIAFSNNYIYAYSTPMVENEFTHVNLVFKKLEINHIAEHSKFFSDLDSVGTLQFNCVCYPDLRRSDTY